MKYLKSFIREWGVFILIIALVGLSRLFLWSNVRVEGHSMDPTLADGEILFVVKHLPIDRFDIVVAHEDEGNKDIVKRVIGLPGDTIRYENDKLYINGQETDEPYLAEYLKRLKRINSNLPILEIVGMEKKANISEVLLKKLKLSP